jgi:hypothetical protein
MKSDMELMSTKLIISESQNAQQKEDVFVPDMVYQEALWMLKKCDHEEKEGSEENQGNEEGKENSDSDSPVPLWYMLEREERG